MTVRVGIPEDIEFDPKHKRQFKLAGYLLGLAINELRDARLVWEDKVDPKLLADKIQDLALENGLVAFDEWHHAPLCPANNWSRARLPTGPCTCGAERHKIR